MYKAETATMKRITSIATLAILAFTLLLSQAFTANASAAALTGFEVTPSVFNPNTQTANINFNTSVAGMVGLEIHKGTEQVKVLALRTDVTPGSQTFTWDGTDRYGAKVTDGLYYVKLVYFGNGFTLYKTGNVTVDSTAGGGGNNGGTHDVITGDYVTPTEFDPNTENSKVYFTLTEDVEALDVSIEKNGQSVIKLVNHVAKDSGTYYATWNGRDSNGTLVNEGTYTYKIYVSGAAFLSETETGSVAVKFANNPPVGTAPQVTGDYASPTSFDSRSESTNIHFNLNTDASVTLKVYKNGALVKTLLTNGQLHNQSYVYNWNGTNSAGVAVTEGTYTYEVSAVNAYGSDSETGSVVVDYINEPTVVDPDITNAYTSQTEIDPTEGETMTIYYTLNTCSYVTIKVYQDTTGNMVRTLLSSVYQCEGQHSVVWNGKDDNGNILPDGDYTIRITATNSEGTDIVDQDAVIDDESNNGGGSQNAPNVYNLTVNRVEFNPEDNETTTLTYSIQNCGDVTVKVFEEDGSYVDTLVNGVNKCNGTFTTTWNGEDSYNDVVDEGEYYFKVYASNSYGSDYETRTVFVDDNGSGGSNGTTDPEITSVDVNPSVFDPFDEDTELEFRLNTCADVTIEVRDQDNDIVAEILNDRNLCSGKHTYSWDGEDEDGDKVRQDTYEFYISAVNSYGSDSAREDVEVDYNGHSYSDGESCAGYRDVSVNDPYCDAIEYVKSRGIFDGYPDGMFRPYQAINRAETSKVIIKGFDYPILSPDGTNLGFWDVMSEAWYIPYLKTGKSYGILQGYPDGSFQPARTVNRVELLKIFLESANVATPHCSVAPYADTPIQADTEWYMPYVCYSKMYGLMDTDYYNRFNPAKPMTRGDVAELFYRFANRSQVNYNNDDYYYNDYYYNPDYTYNNNYIVSGTTTPKISSFSLSDYNVDEGDSFTIYYNLNVRSNVTVEVLDSDGDVVRELLDDLDQSASRHLVVFNGEDDRGRDIDRGDYSVRVVARNSRGSDKEELDFEVDNGTSSRIVDVYDFELSDYVFDPDNETVQLSFKLNRQADVSIFIYDEDDELVRAIWNDRITTAGSYSVSWNGKDRNNRLVTDGDYEIVIEANSSLGDDKERETVEVNR